MSSTNNDIGDSVVARWSTYFRDLDGEKPNAAMYDMVIKQRRAPDARIRARQAGGNQTLCAEMLGINRNTLRRKLSEHELL
jgi:Fis family transcriptional regulator